MKNLKKALSLLLSLMLLLGSFGVLSVYADATASWNESTGTLTVSGSGRVTAEMVLDAAQDISKIKRAVIGEGITSLGDNAFKNCIGLESISLPSSLDSIGSGAFYDCKSLASINIPSGVSVINSDTFSGCVKLKSVTLPSGINKIGDRAFYGCSALKSIDLPNVLESIGSYAFYNCSALTSVVIPTTIDYRTSTANSQLKSYSIGDNAFASCTGLASAFIPALPDTDYSYEQRRIFPQTTIMLVYSPSGAYVDITQAVGNTTAKCIHIPGRIMSWNIGSISAGVFSSYYKMKTAFIPYITANNGFPPSTAIFVNGGESVRGNVNVTSITIPASVTSIAEGAFTGLENLREIEVESDNPVFVSVKGVLYAKDAQGKPVTLICYPQQKQDLDTFTVPDSVTAINTLAFCGSYLKEITIPSGVSSIGARAFKQCSRLKTITVKPDNNDFVSIDGVLYKKNANGNPEELIYYPPKKTGAAFEIPAGVTAIGDYALEDCINLKTVEIPDSVTSIGEGAFKGCNGIDEIEIPDSVTDIGASAFEGIPVKEVVIPDSVTSIGDSAFAGLLNVRYSENMTASGSPWGAKFDNKYYEAPLVFENGQKQAVIYCEPDAVRVAIPVTVNSISSGVFTECAGLTDVFLPAGFTNSGTGTGTVGGDDPGTGIAPVDPGTGIAPVDPGSGTATGGTAMVSGIIFPESVNVWRYSVTDGAETSADGLTHTSISGRDLGSRPFIYCDAMGGGYRIDSAEVAGVGLFHVGNCPDYAPFEIDSYEKLKEFASLVNGGNVYLFAVLTEDIDASSSAQENDWTPIGSSANPYIAGFNGKNHKITGLTFNNPDSDYAGLFGVIGEGGLVRNVCLEGGKITAGMYVGGIAGINNGSIQYCINKAEIYGNYCVGGIAGTLISSIYYCCNEAKVYGKYCVGGIAGAVCGSVDYCRNDAEVLGVNAVGEIAGEAGTVRENHSSISRCFNTGSVTAEDHAGGVVGLFDEYAQSMYIFYCYNTGSVTADDYAGGVVGETTSSNTIDTCYSAGSINKKTKSEDGSVTNNNNTGDVSAAVNIGGISGNYTGIIINCYYDTDMAPGISAFGNSTQSGGLTTAQMTGTNALSNMSGVTSNVWLTKANDENYLYYPHLSGFNLDDNGEQISAKNIDPENWPPKFEKIIPEMELVAPGADYGKTATVTAKLPSKAVSCDVTFYLDGDETGKSVSVSEGKAVCEYTGLTIGEHTVKAVFSGDGCYKGVTDSITFNVNSVDCALTINYQYEDGTEAAETYNGSVAIFREYSVTSPEIPNYTPDPATVEGTMGDDDIDGKTVTVTYTANEYSLTYVVDGNETAVTYKFGDAIAKPADPVKDGFKFTGWDKEIPETMPAENLTITAEFEEILTPTEPTPTEPTPAEPTPTEPTPTEPTPTEPTPTEPTPTEPTPTEPTPTEPTPTEPTPTEPTPTEPTPMEPTPTEPTPTEPTPTEPTPTEPTPTEPTSTEPEPAHEHSYKEEVTTKPTCTEDGIMTYTCECGESYTKAIPKTGHTPGEWKVVTAATTEAAGKEERKCTVCGAVLAEREIAKLEPEETDAGIVSVNLEKTNAFGIANAFGVDPEKLPAGSTVTWYVNGEKAGEGNGFRVDNPTEDYTIKAVVTNRNGKVIAETEETTVKVNNSFFARLYYWLCKLIQKVIDLFK